MLRFSLNWLTWPKLQTQEHPPTNMEKGHITNLSCLVPHGPQQTTKGQNGYWNQLILVCHTDMSFLLNCVLMTEEMKLRWSSCPAQSATPPPSEVFSHSCFSFTPLWKQASLILVLHQLLINSRPFLSGPHSPNLCPVVSKGDNSVGLEALTQTSSY